MSPKSFPSAQCRHCGYRAGVLSMNRPFLAKMDEHLDAEIGKLVKRALAYKGSKRMTLRVDDIKRAYDGAVFGAREERDVA